MPNSITRDDVIKKIKSRGYWVINIHPGVLVKNRLTETDLEALTKSCIVSLRGWDYPHLHDRTGSSYAITNGIEKFFDSGDYLIEFWRMTYSANFLHLVAVLEDWLQGMKFNTMFVGPEKIENKKKLGLIGALYRITEVYEFSRRLGAHDFFDDHVVISMKLHGIEDRIMLSDSYKFLITDPKLSKEKDWVYEKIYDKADFMANSRNHALKAYLDLVRLFNWKNPPVKNFEDIQINFLQGKYI